jgi:hypothetical protein
MSEPESWQAREVTNLDALIALVPFQLFAPSVESFPDSMHPRGHESEAWVWEPSRSSDGRWDVELCYSCFEPGSNSSTGNVWFHQSDTPIDRFGEPPRYQPSWRVVRGMSVTHGRPGDPKGTAATVSIGETFIYTETAVLTEQQLLQVVESLRPITADRWQEVER